mgnify:CR=1 FL=1
MNLFFDSISRDMNYYKEAMEEQKERVQAQVNQLEVELKNAFPNLKGNDLLIKKLAQFLSRQ